MKCVIVKHNSEYSSYYSQITRGRNRRKGTKTFISCHSNSSSQSSVVLRKVLKTIMFRILHTLQF